MIVVLPVCHKDIALAVRNVEHAFNLDGQVEFPCVIAHERGQDVSQLKDTCSCYFSRVDLFEYEPWRGDQSWPFGANWGFQSVARYAAENFKKPWFWWEADATPLRSGWLSELANAYKQGGRPFAGAVTTQGEMTYVAGVAIYPANAAHRLEHALFARNEAFDVVAGVRDGMVRHTHDLSRLICHTISNNTRFTSMSEVERIIPADAVIFHKCKDGSLLDVLQGNTPTPEAQSSSGYNNAPSFVEQTDWPCGYFTFPAQGNTVHFNCSLTQTGSELRLFTRRWRYNIEQRGRVQKENKSDLAIWRVRPSMMLEPTMIVPSVPQRFPGEQWEDPRAMVGDDGRTYLSFATWVHYKPWAIRQSFARLSTDYRAVEPLWEAVYGGNTKMPAMGRTHEKNWIWFQHEGRWVCQYAINPGEFFAVDNRGRVTEKWKSDEIALAWQYGLPLRGGTPLTKVGDELIGFFHTAMPWIKPKRRYFMGAYSLQAKPPFKLLRITNEPLLVGSEQDVRGLNGPLVIFPNGAVLQDKTWLVVFGVNDEACGWIKIPHEELNHRLNEV